MPVRVAMHQTPVFRSKTGVGHYIAQLQAALAQLDPDLEVAGVPDGCLAHVYRGVHALLESSGAGNSASSGAVRSAKKSFLRGGYGRIQSLYFACVKRQ